MDAEFLTRIQNVEKLITPSIIHPSLQLGTNTCLCCNRSGKLTVWNTRVKCWRPQCILNKGPSLIELKALIENITFKESLIKLEEELNITIDDNTSTLNRLSARNKALNECLSIYEYYLWSDLGKPALDYLKSRGFNEQVIKEKRIGFAPHFNCLSWFENIDRQVLNEEGLLNNNRTEYYGNRIIFPIFDINNNLVHFTGRFLGDIKKDEYGNDKYPRYKDTRAVNNLPNIKDYLVFENEINNYANNNRELYVAEGFPDALTLYQHGFNSVGILGIEKVSSHINKFKQFDKVTFILDNDTYFDFVSNKDIYKSYSRVIPQLIKLQTQLGDVEFRLVHVPKIEGVKDVNDWFNLSGNKEEVKRKILDSSISLVEFYIEQEGRDLHKHLEIIKLIRTTKKGENLFRKHITTTDPLKYTLQILNL